MYFLFDTETNGFGPNNEIISIAYMILGADFKKIKSEYILFNREDIAHKWNPDAMKVHGITIGKSKRDGVSLAQHLPRILADEMYGCKKIIAHNLKFDAGVINRACQDLGYSGAPIYKSNGICTMQKARSRARGKERNDLKSTFFRLYPEQPTSVWDNHHNAEFDTRMLANIFVRMVDKKWIEL